MKKSEKARLERQRSKLATIGAITGQENVIIKEGLKAGLDPSDLPWYQERIRHHKQKRKGY